ncbi:HET-domain-containing protein [Penicillium malachiteum]|nr:HET-domain-containing protein [Penicillium malachiteum]
MYTTKLADSDPFLLSFAKSRWFTRGWTLQELIAPKTSFSWLKTGRCYFLGVGCPTISVGSLVGERNSVSLSKALGSLGIAERMSWASNRSTTRKEDEAYSLLGLFGINMPLLYGEGESAFIRLQEEILKNSDDQSLLA